MTGAIRGLMVGLMLGTGQAAAGVADLPVAALDRCMAGAGDIDAMACGQQFLGWCDDMPNPDACRTEYGAAVMQRIADFRAQLQAAGVSADQLDRAAAWKPANELFD